MITSSSICPFFLLGDFSLEDLSPGERPDFAFLPGDLFGELESFESGL